MLEITTKSCENQTSHWFIDGIQMTQDQYESECARIRSYDWEHVSNIGFNLLLDRDGTFDRVMQCWAYAFFRGGEGYSVFWRFVYNVYGDRIDQNRLYRFLGEYIAKRFNLTDRAIRRWFLKYCWLVDGLPSANGRPRGYSSPMARSLVELYDALASGDDVAERISELVDGPKR